MKLREPIFQARGGAKLLALCFGCTVALFMGWGLRSCGLAFDPLITYGLIGPLVHWLIIVPLLVASFILGGFLGEGRLGKSFNVIVIVVILCVACLAGYALLAPAGCRLDI